MNEYPSGIKVEDEELDKVNLTGNEFHLEWNHTVKSRNAQFFTNVPQTTKLKF